MELYFVRHGQTDFNLARKIQGQEIDASLNDEGIKQVEAAALRLPKGITLLFSSPLKRAYESAEIISKRIGVPITVSDLIKEMSFGTLAGKTWAENEAKTGETGMKEKEDNLTYDYRPYGGESHEDMRRRVKGFIEELQRNNQDDVVLVVAHGGIIRIMHSLYPQKEVPETVNASIHEFIF